MIRGRNSRYCGFTLIELLVVIAIIAILLALLLPTVMKVRDMAARLECTNNLKQLGLAAHAYNQVHKVLPPSVVTKPKTHNWVAFLLPYFEEGNLYKQYRFNVHWHNKKNRPLLQTRMAILQCAAAPQYKRIDRDPRGFVLAPSDYAPTTGVAGNLVNAGYVPRTKNLGGAMIANGQLTTRLVRDGTSTTILIGEDAGRPDHWISGGKGPDDNVNGGGNFNVSGGRVLGAGWADPANTIPLHGFTRNGLRAPGPCAVNCTNNNEAFGFHGNGANFVFVDGSVHYFTTYINIRTYAALITRDGKETISEFDF